MNRRPMVTKAARRVGLLAGLGFAAGLLLSGCVTQTLATQIVAAPNRHGLPQPYRS